MSIVKIKIWAELICDVGLILGIPVLITVGIKLYDRQVEVLKSQVDFLKIQNESLKNSQYDRAASILEGQKKVFEIEREGLDNQIKRLKGSHSREDIEKVIQLEKQLDEVRIKMKSLDKNREILTKANFVQSIFEDDVSFQKVVFKNHVDFGESTFSNNASFYRTIFSAPVVFDFADLTKGSFKQTDFRGVDLSNAIIDSKTKLPQLK